MSCASNLERSECSFNFNLIIFEKATKRCAHGGRNETGLLSQKSKF